MKKRLFVAIDIPPKIKQKIAILQNELKSTEPTATWVKPENMHLSLAFLGESDYNQIPDIIESLDKIKDDSFKIVLSNLDGFPNLAYPHTLWIGVEENLGLFYLQQKIAQHLKKLKLRLDEKKFIPHLTIARLSSRKSIKKLIPKDGVGKFKAKEFILYESELLAEGPKHTPIKNFHLQDV